MPTSVHLLVQQQFADGAAPPLPSVEAPESPVASIDLAGAPVRLVLHFVALLRDVARGVASDKGKGGAGLEALRVFDRHHADIDAVLTLAGNSDLFVAMVQLGRDVFETRLSSQRLVEIYERLLGILMSRRPNTTAASKATQRGSRIRQLIQRFGEQVPAASGQQVGPRGAGLHRTNSTPVAPLRPGGRPCARTVPCTPVHPRTPGSRRCSVSDLDDEDGSEGMLARIESHGFLGQAARVVEASQDLEESQTRGTRHEDAEVLPGSLGKTQNKTATKARPPLRRRHTHTAALIESTFQQATAGSQADAAPLTGPFPSGADLRYPPSYVFAAPEAACGDEAMESAVDPGACTTAAGAGESSDGAIDSAATAADGAKVLRPSWCQVLTVEQNHWLRQELEKLLEAAPFGGLSPKSAGLEVTSKWGEWQVRWHEEEAHDEVLVEVLLRLGSAYSSLGRFAHAAQLLRKALLRVEEMVQRGTCPGLCAEHMRAELLSTLSSILCQQGLREDAEAMLWQARQLAKHSGESSALYIKITCELAEFNHKFKGNLKAAHHLFKQGLEKRIQTLGYDHLDTAYSLNQLGVYSAHRGEHEEAKRLIVQAIRIRRRLVGNSHLSVAEAYHNLAGVEENLKNYNESAGLYESALQIKRKALPEYHVSIADTQNNLSIVYQHLKKHEDCVRLLRQTLEQCLRTVGETNLSTASVLMNLGHALHCLATANRAESSQSWYKAQLEESLGLLERSLSAKKALVDKHHPSMALLRSNLGFALYKMEAYAKAERHFCAAVRISQKHYGGVHQDVARWKYWVGKTQIRAGQVAKGRDRLREALEICVAGPSAFTAEQFEEIHLLLGESDDEEDACMSDSAGEPAAEPPSADCQGTQTFPLHGWRHSGRRSPQIDLSLLAQPDDEPDAEVTSEGRMSGDSPTASSLSDDTGCRTRISESPRPRSSPVGASEPASSPTSEVGLSRIMKHVRRSVEEYEVMQHWSDT